MSNLTGLLNSRERSKEWAKRCVDAAATEAEGAYTRHRRDKICYDLFAGSPSVNQFDYLTGNKDMKYPAQVRFIPIMRPMFEVLRSTESTRPTNPRVITTDSMSVEKKFKERNSTVLDSVMQRLHAQQYRIEVTRQQIQEQLRAASEAGNTSAAANMKMQQAMFQLQSIDQDQGRYQEILHQELKKADQYYRYRHQTREEKAMSLALGYWMTKYNIDDLFMQGFDDLFITDNEIYYIPDVPKGMDPKLRKCHIMDVVYPAEMGVTYLDELSWICEVEYMTAAQLSEEFQDLTAAELEQVGLGENLYVPGPYSTYGYANQFNENPYGATNSGDYAYNENEAYSGSTPSAGMVPVYRVCWRVWRELTAKELEEAGVLSEYVTDMSEEEMQAAGIEKGGTPDHWMVSDVWEGVRIGRNVYRKLRKRPMQFRDRQHVGFSYLPYVGFAYNGVDRKPYSMVWAVRDIQILYNLISYQKEVLIAMAGVKGFLMDMSQMPDGMEMEEWLYYLKQGIGLLQSQRDGQRPSQFNQFSTFDMSVSDGVFKLDESLQRLEMMMGRVLGVPPQRMGDVAPGALNGATQQAVANSTLTTEMLFYKHRQLKGRALNRIIQVAERTWSEGKRGLYVAGDLGQEAFELRAEDLGSCTYELFYNDSRKDAKIRDTMEQAIMQQYGTGAVTLSQMAAVLSASSINEVTDLLEQFEKEAAERASAAEDKRIAGQKEIENLKMQAQMALKQGDERAKQIELELARAEQQLNLIMAQTEMKAKAQEAGMKDKTERYRIDTERDTEMAYLQYERERDSVDAKLRMLELQTKTGGETKDSLPNSTKQRVKD